MIYLDNAATTVKKPPQVAEAVADAIRCMGNPGRSGHRAAQLAAEAVFECRELASDFFELPAANVVFTMNATHALNIAIRSLVAPGRRVVISGFEHNSVTRPLAALNAEIIVAGTKLFDAEGCLAEYDRTITPDTAAVIVSHISNVFGFVQPLERIAAICAARNVPLIVDAAQSAGVLPISVEKLHAAFVAMPGHKTLFGPQGTGLLLCGTCPQPLLYGGTGAYSLQQSMPEELPERIEAGTLNVPGICGLAEGLKYVQKRGTQNIRMHEKNLTQLLSSHLKTLPGCRVFYTDADCHLGAVSVVFEGKDCEQVAEELSEHGIAVRSGLHCAPLAHRSAGTLKTGTVRFSVCDMNTEAEIRKFSAIFP